MPRVSGGLRLASDPTNLPVVIDIEDDTLAISASGAEIGRWHLADLDIERRGMDVAVTAEGETMFLRVPDPTAFITLATASTGRFKKRRGRSAPPPTPAAAEVTPAPTPNRSTGPAPKGDLDDRDVVGTALRRVRGLRTEIPGLPELPLAAIVGIIAVFVILVVLIPGIFAGVLGIGGAVLAVAGVAGLNDSMLASRFPGTLTPTAAIVIGIVMILLAVVVLAFA